MTKAQIKGMLSMKGCCSNSPARCHHAFNVDVIESADGMCPHCRMTLLSTDNQAVTASFKDYKTVLQAFLLVFVMLGLSLSYWYFIIAK